MRAGCVLYLCLKISKQQLQTVLLQRCCVLHEAAIVLFLEAALFCFADWLVELFGRVDNALAGPRHVPARA